MNYYYWSGDSGNSGNVFARSEQEAKAIVLRFFEETPVFLELLKEDVVMNRFTGEIYYSATYGD